MEAWKHPVAYSSWDREERAAIDRVVKSGRFTMGAEVEAFEHEFAEYHRMRHGIMVNSGSSANLVAVEALFHKADRPLSSGDVALVPAIAWATTYAPLAQKEMVLFVADVDDTWNVPARAIDPMARLVVRCSVLGNPTCDSILPDAYVIEDNCESLGAWYATGRPCGTTGMLNTFSFFWSHQLSAIEGGMILTNDDELATLCRLLRNHGNAGFGRRDASFAESYDFRLFGYNLRPLEMHAAVARAQLRKLDGFIEHRRANWLNFKSELETSSKWSHVVKFPKQNGVISPFGLQFEVREPKQRAKLVGALRAEGIDARLPTGGSFLRHAYGAPYRLGSATTPRADEIHDCGLFLGNPPWLLDAEIENAARIIRSVCG